MTTVTPDSADWILGLLGIPAAERAAIASAGSPAEARAAVERTVARRVLRDRLEAVTALAGGLAHELNNPLAYVLSNLAFLAERTARIADIAAGKPPTPDDAALATQVAEAMHEARTGAERMRSIVRDLRMLSHLDEQSRRAVDLLPVLESCLNVAWSSLSCAAEVVRELRPVPRVLGDEGHLAQLFLNLLLNAAQAIPPGCAGSHRIRVAALTLPEGHVAVEVSDTGTGIAPEHLGRVFDPFFTTKAPGWGRGLGLSICHAVVTSMGGEIHVESDLGKGSTFRVLLPPAPAGSDTPVPP
ncbi:MAG TPA: ATP-binding protein [Anaeromyxobacter sp.]